METYKIIRYFRDGRCPRTVKKGLTLALAQEHCKSEKTHKTHKKDNKGEVVWFDGYTKE